MRKNKIKNYWVFLLLLVPLALPGQNGFSGNIIRNTRWSGRVIIEGDVVVKKGITLSIEPGTQVLIRANYDRRKSGKDPEKTEIVVLGTLLANGGKGLGEILFTTFSPDALPPQAGSWQGIIIKKSLKPSRLKGCVIEYAYNGITCWGSSPEIDDCKIRFSHYAGISCEIRSHAVIRNSLLIRNGFAGLICELASNPIVENCAIQENRNGIIIFDRSQPDLGHFPGTEGKSSGNNQFIDNIENSIFNKSSREIQARNNIWGTNKSTVISEMILDEQDNTSYGPVIFKPVFKKTPSYVSTRRRPIKKNLAVDANNPTPSSPPAFRSNKNITGAPSTNGFNHSSPHSPVKQTDPATPTVTGPGDSLSLHDSSSILTKDSKIESPSDTGHFTQTVIPDSLQIINASDLNQLAPSQVPPNSSLIVFETQLDAKKREYIKVEKPEYPNIYLSTGYEGIVVLEVIVGYRGEVESYRVLRSNGEYFKSAVEKTIKNFVYKPGTYQGKPVKFRLYESFVFKQDK